MTVPSETFNPISTPAADWSDPANWSGGVVPGAGVAAAITGTTALLDPGVTIEASLALAGAAVLSGNDGAVVLGSSAAVTISGSGALYANDSVVNQGVIALGAASSLSVVVELGALSGLTGAAPPSFANTGTIALETGATLAITGTAFENTGTLALAGGTLMLDGGALGGGGTIDLAGGALAWLGDGVADQQVSFAGGTLALADPLLGAAVSLTGFTSGDVLLLPTLADARIAQSNGQVTIETATGIVEGSFALAGAPALSVVASGSGSAVVIAAASAPAPAYDPPCFARGTAILTPSGYRPVEHLAVGDPVITASAGVQPIVWVGQHTSDLATHPAPHRVQPIRIAAGALAHSVPRRALRVSPDHAIALDGVLIPAKLLVNGATIIQEQDCLAITYHHIELARHDIVLAEAAPCETYLDTGNRAGFSTASSWPVRQKRWDRDACAPLVTAGARLRRSRAALHDRACALGFAPAAAATVGLWIDGRPAARDAAGRFAVPLVHGGRAIIRSHRFIPAHFDPGSDDRRELGVAITTLRAGRRHFNPDDLAQSGFHPRASGDTARWTDGNGVIHLPTCVRSIAVDIAGLPLAWQRAAPPQ
ncbi:MAG: hypothetical protein B7Z58_03830 [Acidiphilium sp. 37-64-53]|uniref:Hint domain-containing protein n=1 Tax=Acidiphilium TaxID=522 RepID=UPI000BC9EA1E|nr:MULTISPECIES: Hint domain-containing protein [Acidiphilium]OYW03437.1 MAG: hypothetical protein B7Z58_03830 [Acidiphilium sp. 37-64-53]OZB30762.1 MAG: hypothetical protein B7X49_01880 [Acidiphilium sp. 34-64-41]HQT84605.1 Hint domain-containing protein [Acidiphilium rubrum]